jgi:PAS domain S-box-containing protein
MEKERKSNRWKLFTFDGRINKNCLFAMLSVLCVAGYIGTKNFLLFHALTEIFTILVGFSIALIVLNTYRNLQRDFISIIGIAYAFAGVFDILHTLSYRGMGVLPDDSANLPTQMWIIARYLDGIGMLVAGVSLYRIIKPFYVLIAYAAISGLTMLAVFYWGVFPVCFIEGQGLTFFKIYSEYIICLILITSVIFLMRHKRGFQLHEYYPLLFFFLVSIFTELSFTFYKNVGRWDSIIGHLFKTVAFFFLYHAVVVTNLHEPYNRVRSQARLLDLAHDYIMVRDLDNRILYWNHGAEIGYGWKASEALGQVAYSLLLTEFPEHVEHIMATLLTKGHWEGELVHTRKNGERIMVVSYQTLNLDPMGQPASILEINHDITQQKIARDDLKRSEFRFQHCIDNIGDNFTFFKALRDESGKIVDFVCEFVNAVECQTRGKPMKDLIGRRMLEIWPEVAGKIFDDYCRVCETGELLKDELICSYDEGNSHHAGIYERKAIKLEDGVAICTRDITEKRRQEEAILTLKEAQVKAEKLASIGAMAAGICHEINQPLNSLKMISSAFTYSYKQGNQRSIEEFVLGMQEISNQVDRVTKIITHLRSFVRRDDSLLVSCDINAAVVKSLELIGRQIAAHGITVHKHLQENLPEVLAIPTALEEVIINLLVNSMQALGTIQNLDKQIIVRTYFDDGIVAEICDNGPGVNPQLGQKIFEPFVSTKSGGDSLGLGLTIVNSIVTSCYGTIQLVSEGNSGAIFRIKFQPYIRSVS